MAHCRSQPYRLDPPVTKETIPQIVTNADEMFQILFEDLNVLCDEVNAIDVTSTSATGSVQSGQQLAFGFGNPAEGEQGPMGPPGLQGLQGIQGVPGAIGWPGRDGDDGAVWALGPPELVAPLHGGTGIQSYLLGDILYASGASTLAALPGNITSTQKFLTQTGTGTASAAPSWQAVPSVGSLVFFLFDTASDIAGYKVMKTPASVGGDQTVTAAALGAGNTTIEEWATLSGVPNVTFVPAGVCTCYVTARQSAGTKTSQLFAEIYQRTSGGVETLLATTALTIPLTGINAAYIFQGAIPFSLVFVSTDRVVMKIRAAVSGGGSDPDVVLTYEGVTAARGEFPSATVDATNFVPYLGATADVDLGAKTLKTPTLIGGGAVGSTLTLKPTTAVGVSGADIIFGVGNNGATEAMRIFNAGNVTSQGIFTSNFPAGGGFVIDNPTADAGVVGQSYMTFQTADVARWFLGMSASAGDGGFQLFNGIAGAATWSVNKTTNLTSILAGLTVTGVITGTSLTVTNPVTVPNGGTGVATLADAGVLIGNGAGVVQVTTAGTAGEVLTSNGAGVDPTFQPSSGSPGTAAAPIPWPGRDGEDATEWKYVAPPGPFTPVFASAYTVSADQTVTAGADNTVLFNTEDTDSGEVHSTSSNTGRFVVPTGGAGKYLVGCSILITSVSPEIGQYTLRAQVNGADVNGGTAILFSPGNGGNMGLNQSTMLPLADGDYVTFVLFPNVAANKTILTGASVTFYNPRGWIVRVA